MVTRITSSTLSSQAQSTMTAPVHCIVLAAGKGTRMVSSLPKVMHAVGSWPLIGHVLATLQTFRGYYGEGATRVVIAPAQETVRAFVAQHYSTVDVALQGEQLGTAHAVSYGLEGIEAGAHDPVFVLFGDTPLIHPETLTRLTQALQDKDLVVGGMYPHDPKSYGRLVLDETGQLTKIVEFKHASDAEKAIGFCNSGIMAFRFGVLKDVLQLIQPQALNGEYYLTDAVALAMAKGVQVGVVEIAAQEVEGVNTRRDLAQAESQFQSRRRQDVMDQGVTLISPETVYFAYDTVVEGDVYMEPHVYFGPGVVVKKGSVIKAFSHLEGTCLEEGATVGPFARLRPGAVIGTGARIGNFVEVKNATFAAGAKANHLSYVGDATVGAGANLGAGTITCNYDGYFKHETTIGEGAFVGSNSCLVAPVSIGAYAIVGAASTVTKNVAADALSVARAPQKDFEGKARQIHGQKAKLKEQLKEKVA